MKIKDFFSQYQGETLAYFGQARLVKQLDGKLELVGGSRDDRASAREWISMFFHEGVVREAREVKRHLLALTWLRAYRKQSGCRFFTIMSLFYNAWCLATPLRLLKFACLKHCANRIRAERSPSPRNNPLLTMGFRHKIEIIAPIFE